MNTAEAAAYLRFVDEDGAPDLVAVRAYFKKYEIETVRRGSALLVRRDALEASLRRERVAPVRRRRVAAAVASVSGC